jgi:hypothetical protein
VTGDCNRNGIPDEEDLVAGTSLDADGSGIPDECEVSAPTLGGGFRANRYIAVNPDNGPYTVAFELTITEGPGAPGPLGWLGEPVEAGCPDACSGTFVSRIVDEPVFRVWDEPVVYVADCGIAPDSVYSIRTTGDGENFSAPQDGFSTVPKPDKEWADVVGEKFVDTWLPADGFVNFNDIQAAVQNFEGASDAPPDYLIDLADEVPNMVVNLTDVQMIILAFEGGLYPYSEPRSCP